MSIVKWVVNFIESKSKSPTIKILLDGRVQIDYSEIDFFNKFVPIFEHKSNVEVTLDLSKSEFIYPNVLLFLIALSDTLAEGKKKLTILINNGSSVHEYLDYSGFCEKFNIAKLPTGHTKGAMNNDDVFKLDSPMSTQSNTVIANSLVNFLKARQNISPRVSAELLACIDEILRNTRQHSSYTQQFLIAQAYPTSNRVRFVFYDNGVGIRAHMTRKPYELNHKLFKGLISREVFEELKTNSANLAIFEAAKYTVSATDYIENSGAGLDFIISDLSPLTNGRVSIISDNGIVVWQDGNKIPVVNSSIPYKIKGTLVSLTFNCDPETIIKYRDE